jgi:hypothetical protein
MHLNKEIEMHIQNRKAMQEMFNDQTKKLEIAEKWALQEKQKCHLAMEEA